MGRGGGNTGELMICCGETKYPNNSRCFPRKYANVSPPRKYMGKHSLEIFMPFPSGCEGLDFVRNLIDNTNVERVWLWSAGQRDSELPAKVAVLNTDSLDATAVFADMAQRATADYVVYMAKEGIRVDSDTFDRMCDAIPQSASMVYSDYKKEIDKCMKVCYNS